MKCPGQDTFYWKPGAIYEVPCPQCGAQVEFFKDDTTRKCSACRHRFVNPNLDFGCAAYCQYAEQCIGTLPEEFLVRQEDLLKDRVAIEIKRRFRGDFKRIGHATRVARYAERIARAEGANPAVVLCAAYLYDIGAAAVGRSPDGRTLNDSPPSGPAVARDILQQLGAKPALIDAVGDILAHGRDYGPGSSLDSKVVHDANRLADLEERRRTDRLGPEPIETLIAQTFLTDGGRNQARAVLGP